MVKRRGDRRPVTAVDRAACVLAAFTDSWDFLTLPEIGRRARLSKATTFRILATLAEQGLVFQNEANSTYGLGFLTLRLADVVLGGIALRELSRSAMRVIRDAVNETVVLAVRQGDACCDVDSLEGSNMIAQSQLLGMPVSLHASAPGRALLAGLSDDAIAAYLAHASRVSASNVPAPARLNRDIRQIRRDGYAVGSGDFMLGGHTVAVAIRDATGAAVGALHISFPQARFSKELEARCIKALTAGATAISGALKRP